MPQVADTLVDPKVWRAFAVSVRGTSHETTGLPCQDFSQAIERNEIAIAAVADGVGSAKHSEIGAKLAVETAIQFLEKQAIVDQDWVSVLKQAAQESLNAITKHAQDNSLSPRDLACTLLLGVCKPGHVGFLHIGDGGVVALFGENDLEVLSMPRKGEFANEVLPITSRGAIDTAVIQKADRNIKALALFSDGIENVCLNLKEKKAHPKFFLPIFTSATSQPETDFETSLRNLLAKKVSLKSDDDLSLVVLVQESSTQHNTPETPTDQNTNPPNQHTQHEPPIKNDFPKTIPFPQPQTPNPLKKENEPKQASIPVVAKNKTIEEKSQETFGLVEILMIAIACTLVILGVYLSKQPPDENQKNSPSTITSQPTPPQPSGTPTKQPEQPAQPQINNPEPNPPPKTNKRKK